MRLGCILSAFAALTLIVPLASAPAAEPKPLWKSKVLGKGTEKVDVDLKDAKQLVLVVGDGGDGYACDWADWLDPKLIGADGKATKLTDLKWKSGSTGWGKLNVNRNCGGNPLSVAGKTYENGLGTHANSVIIYDIAGKGFKTFQATAAPDDGGVNQGNATSVQFAVYGEASPAVLAAARRSSGGGGGNNASRAPELAVENLDVGEGLAAQLFAAEPMLLSPSDIDVDARGRVWVCEVVNYRGRNGQRPEGDRILILEDTNGDGKADQQKVYYQGRDIDSALGICVLGNKVIVSVSPNVFVFTDTDGDDKPDKKELLFTKTGQQQHDHSAHAFTFGPDGKLYWNFGNVGHSVHDKDGKPVVSTEGHEVNDRGQPYRQGMAFRCNADGSEFEVLGHNFRNNYEVAVDSFGTAWQSDNDDDGNRGVRINYVMEHGNFGYTDEFTGAGWKTPRTNQPEDTPSRHWYQNSPGVVPNLLQTGGGSPTGICVYEGKLLPKRFWGQVIHCDAGPNVVRAYPAQKDGAGYKAGMDNILEGSRDKWFRPSDVCVAPDGSLIVADWYDPGVGGHAMGDIDRGRIFRVAPPDTPYKIPKYDLKTAAGAIEALQNPNLSVRYLAWTALHEMQAGAESDLRKLYESSDDPRMRARALHLLARIDGKTQQYVDAALADKDPDIRITGLRIARQEKLDVLPLVKKLVKDPSPQVRRECAIALRGNTSSEAAQLWAELALQHDGADRWYLEALGIGMHGQEDAFFDAWLQRIGDNWNTPAGRDIIWRSRAKAAAPLLARIILDKATDAKAALRYFRAFDFHRGDEKQAPLLELLVQSSTVGDAAKQGTVATESSRRLGGGADSGAVKKVLAQLLPKLRKSSPKDFLALVQKFNLKEENPALIEIALAHADQTLGADAAYQVLQAGGNKQFVELLSGEDKDAAQKAAQALGNVGNRAGAAILLLDAVKNDQLDAAVRRAALQGVVLSKAGAQQVLQMAEKNTLAPELKIAATLALNSSRDRDIKAQAAKVLPLPQAAGAQLPPLDQLVARKGDIGRGQKMFVEKTCAKCHRVGSEGTQVGPDLTEIGSKLSREAMFLSVLDPDAGIGMGFETYNVITTDGQVVSGLITSRTKEQVVLKLATGIEQTIPMAQVDEIAQQKISIMPADIVKTMTAQDLIDIVDYMQTLKKPAAGK